MGMILVYLGMRTMGASNKASLASVAGLAALKWGPESRMARWLGFDAEKQEDNRKFAREGRA